MTENTNDRMRAMADTRRQWRESWEQRLQWARDDLAHAEERLQLERVNVTALKRLIRSIERTMDGIPPEEWEDPADED